MEKNFVLSGNKLIAEFMKWNIVIDDAQIWGVKVPSEYLINDNMDWYTSEELEFHKSWNWLMPVVKKIESLDKIEGCKYLVTICSDVCRIDTVNDEITWKRGSTKILAVYQAVIKFIEWYNKENKL